MFLNKHEKKQFSEKITTLWKHQAPWQGISMKVFEYFFVMLVFH